MRPHSIEQLSEADAAYWRYRVASLECLVSELLMKNQRMRFVLETSTQHLPATPVEMAANQNLSRNPN